MTEDAQGDWRLTGQQRYLMGVTLLRRRYRQNPANPAWDHDHCEFCWATFSLVPGDDTLQEGYATPDDDHWICTSCFEEFKASFAWVVAPAGDA